MSCGGLNHESRRSSSGPVLPVLAWATRTQMLVPMWVMLELWECPARIVIRRDGKAFAIPWIARPADRFT